MMSVTGTQLCHCSMKAATPQCIDMSASQQNRHQAGFGLWATVCQFLPQSHHLEILYISFRPKKNIISIQTYQKTPVQIADIISILCSLLKVPVAVGKCWNRTRFPDLLRELSLSAAYLRLHLSGSLYNQQPLTKTSYSEKNKPKNMQGSISK